MQGTQLEVGDSFRRGLLSASAKGFLGVVEALVPVTEYDDRKHALVSACTHGHRAVASYLIAGLPGRFLKDQPLACATSLGQADIAQKILSSRDSGEITSDALIHARDLARSKEEWPTASLLCSFIRAHFPEEDDEQGNGGYLPPLLGGH